MYLYMKEEEFRRLLLRASNGKLTSKEKDLLDRLVNETNLKNSQEPDVSHIQREITGTILKRLKKQRRINASRSLLKYAAAILVMVVSYFSYSYIKSDSKKTINTAAPVKLVEYYSEYGQQSNLILGDGSKIKLNAGTKLSYPEKFTGNQRKLFLEGQAFFDVSSDTTKPFVISTGNIEVKVLGTSFEIKAYKDDDIATVTVLSGKVKVAINGKEGNIILGPDDRMVYEMVNNEYKIQRVDAGESIAWVNGVLLFEESILEDVFRQMERWYDLKIIVLEGINSNCTVSGRHKNQGYQIVLEGLAYTHGLEYQIKNDTVFITKINCE